MVVRWHPRETGWARHADALSKWHDEADYSLAANVYQRVTRQLGVQPVLDLFAAAHNSKCSRFYSVYLQQGCSQAAVDALLQDWGRGSVGDKEVAYAFTPPQLYSAVVRKLLEEPHGAVLLIVFSHAEHIVQQHAWRQLQRQVQAQRHLGPAEALVQPGPLYPRDQRLPTGHLMALLLAATSQ